MLSLVSPLQSLRIDVSEDSRQLAPAPGPDCPGQAGADSDTRSRSFDTESRSRGQREVSDIRSHLLDISRSVQFVLRDPY